MKTAVYPGSFDPLTNGHLDIIKRASKIFDKIVVAVLENPEKKNGLFTNEERIKLIQKSTLNIPGIEILCFKGLLVDFMKEHHCNVIVKGLRTTADFEYEIQMAQINNMLDADIETLFLMTASNYSYISSSYVRQIAMYGGNIQEFVPAAIIEDVKNKIQVR